jgi:hypothetical protein
MKTPRLVSPSRSLAFAKASQHPAVVILTAEEYSNDGHYPLSVVYVEVYDRALLCRRTNARQNIVADRPLMRKVSQRFERFVDASHACACHFPGSVRAFSELNVRLNQKVED